MRRLPVLAAFALAVATAAPAHAYVPPAGQNCTLVAIGDETVEGTMLGVLSGGPLTAAGTTMTLVCSIQVGGTGLHIEADSAAVSAGPSATSVTLPPTAVSFEAAPTMPTYVCTRVRQVDANNVITDLYWDAATSTWSTIPATSYCALVPPPAAPVEGGILVIHPASGPVQAMPFGVLADPLEWSCSIPAYNPAVPFVATCTAITSTPWTCSVVVASAWTHDAAAVVRTGADCDGNGVYEAQTGVAAGLYDGDGAFATPGTPTTSFVCRLDDGGTAGPVGGYVAFCSDPGGPPVR